MSRYSVTFRHAQNITQHQQYQRWEIKAKLALLAKLWAKTLWVIILLIYHLLPISPFLRTFWLWIYTWKEELCSSSTANLLLNLLPVRRTLLSSCHPQGSLGGDFDITNRDISWGKSSLNEMNKSPLTQQCPSSRGAQKGNEMQFQMPWPGLMF